MIDKCVFLIFLILPLVSQTVQEDRNAVELSVNQNGQKTSNPDEIILTSNGQSRRLPVRESKVILPKEISTTEGESQVEIDIGHDIIKVDIPNKDFTMNHWTIYIADRAYNEDISYAVPDNADIPKSCIIVFDRAGFNAYGTFFPDCRTKR